MPYLHITIAAKESIQEDKKITEQIVDTLMKHTEHGLGKKPEVTAINLEYVSDRQWFIGGESLTEQSLSSFYLTIKITEGTNTKAQKAEYVQRVFEGMETIFGKLAPASYIVIDDIGADSWGFAGKTQEFRYIQAQAL